MGQGNPHDRNPTSSSPSRESSDRTARLAIGRLDPPCARRLALISVLDPAKAMAGDAAMLSFAEQGEASIRVYRWGEVCVTLGRNQRLDVLVKPGETKWAHRPTGGAAVLHGHDVTLSAAIPLTSRVKPRELYVVLARLAIEYLAHHGVKAQLAGGQGTRETPGYCFAASSPGDVVEANSGIKICGCALRVTHRAALLQTSIPYTHPRIDPSEIIRGAKHIGTPEWRPDEDFDPRELPSWKRYAGVGVIVKP